MQTQGISLMSTGNLTAKSSGKGNGKADALAFDHYMTGRTRNSSDGADYVRSDEKPQDNDYAKLSSKNTTNKSGVNMQKESLCKRNDPESGIKAGFGKKQNAPEEADVEAFSERMAELLAEVFQMTEEEITDILEQNGISISELMFDVGQDNALSFVNTDALQKLVMCVHGVEDKAVFLTNDMLSGELSELTNVVEEACAELFGVEPDELEALSDSLMQSFAEALADMEKSLSHEKTERAEVAAVPGEWDDSDATGSAEIPIIVEKYEAAEDGTSQMKNDEESFGTPQNPDAKNQMADVAATENTAAELFTERLSQAFVKETDQAVQDSQSVMRTIVDQVVRQVKIRVLPETTNMELKLNPESLGKINLQVSSTSGIASAVLTVENQTAKEALESQMQILRQAFEEQGLKVDAVEVTVSEFGLRQEDPGYDRQNSNGSEGKHKFRENAGENAVGERAEDAVQTAEERRSADSLIDYTA